MLRRESGNGDLGSSSGGGEGGEQKPLMSAQVGGNTYSLSLPSGLLGGVIGGTSSTSGIEQGNSNIDREAEGYGWDLCIVYNNSMHTEKIPQIVVDLNKIGLETFNYYSVERDALIIKVRADVERLSKHATDTGFQFLLDEVELKEAAEAGISDKVRPIYIPHDPEITEMKPYSNIYCHFPDEKDTHLLSLFSHANGLYHPFGAVARIKLLISLIRTDAGYDLPHMLDQGQVLGFFPYRDLKIASPLFDKIKDYRSLPWDLEIDDLKDYLGEQLGFYFGVLAHFTSLLVPLSAIGLLVFLLLVITDSLSTGGFLTPLYALAVCAWSQITIELWKRTQAVKAVEWGMADFDSDENILASFEGEIRASVIDGSQTRYFPEKDKFIRRMVSAGGFLAALIISLASMIIFFIMDLIFGPTFTYVIVAIIIKIFSMIITHVSSWLTLRENHRLESEFEDALITKVFIFEFINNFGMLFYIAFFRTMLGDTCSSSVNGSCMGDLSLALFIIYVFRVVVANAEAMIWPLAEPFVKSCMKASAQKFLDWYQEEFPDAEATTPESSPHREIFDSLKESLTKRGEEEDMKAKKKQLMEVMSPSELEFNLETFEPIVSAAQLYSDVVIQFGYVTLFVAAFPLAPLFALVNNYLKVRIDAWNLLCVMRRPVPVSAKGIGSWEACLQTISYISVITNSGIICFTMSSTVTTTEFTMFVVMQYVIFVIMTGVNYFVPDVPPSVTIQLKRQQLLLKKVIEAVPDVAQRNWTPVVSSTADLAPRQNEDV